jgi:hypothetical protein
VLEHLAPEDGGLGAVFGLAGDGAGIASDAQIQVDDDRELRDD